MTKNKNNSLEKHLETLFRLIQKHDISEIEKFMSEAEATATGFELVKARGKKSGDYAVTVAARHGRKDVLEYLREKYEASFELPNSDGKRPLHEASQSGHVTCVDFLLTSGIDVDALKRATWTPLMLACAKDNLEVIRLLVEAGASYKTLKNKDGWTCFHIACREGHVVILRFFLDLDSSLWKTRSNVGRTPLHTAATNGKGEAVHLLLEAWGRGQREQQSQQLQHQEQHQLQQQEQQLKQQQHQLQHNSQQQPSLNCLDACGSTPFSDAIKAGHTDIARIILDCFEKQQQKQQQPAISPLHVPDSLGRSPLDIAAMCGHLHCLQFITEEELKRHRNLKDVFLRSKTESRNRVPLHYAAQEGHVVVVEFILEKLKAEGLTTEEILTLDGEGKSARDLAAFGGHTRCVELLEGVR